MRILLLEDQDRLRTSTKKGLEEMGIAVESADHFRIVGNTLADNGVAQLQMRKALYTSQGNCFDRGGEDQLIAFVDFHERYDTLAEFRRAAGQDTGSREGCGRLPAVLDVRSLHNRSLAYTPRARKKLAKR